MNRPLWQILFAMTFAAFAVQRVAVGYTLAGGAVSPVVLVLWGLAVCVALALAIAMAADLSWPVSAMAAGVGGLLGLAALTQGWMLGVAPVGAVIGEAALAVLLAGGLAWLLRGRPGVDSAE